MNKLCRTGRLRASATVHPTLCTKLSTENVDKSLSRGGAAKEPNGRLESGCFSGRHRDQEGGEAEFGTVDVACQFV